MTATTKTYDRQMTDIRYSMDTAHHDNVNAHTAHRHNTIRHLSHSANRLRIRGIARGVRRARLLLLRAPRRRLLSIGGDRRRRRALVDATAVVHGGRHRHCGGRHVHATRQIQSNAWLEAFANSFADVHVAWQRGWVVDNYRSTGWASSYHSVTHIAGAALLEKVGGGRRRRWCWQC